MDLEEWAYADSAEDREGEGPLSDDDVYEAAYEQLPAIFADEDED